MAVKEPKAPAKREPEYIDKPSPFSIEGIRSGAVQSRVVKTMIVMSGLIMAGTFAISSFSPTGVPQNGSNTSQQSPTESVATVGDQTVTAGDVNFTLGNNIRTSLQYGFGQAPTVATFLNQKQDALRQLTDNAALVVAAQKQGVTVSDAEIDKEVDKQLTQQYERQKQPQQSEASFLRYIQSQYKVASLEELVAQDKAKVTTEGREQVRKQLLVEKIEKQYKDATKVTDEDYKRSVTKLDLYQIVLQPDLPKGNVKDFAAEQKKLQDANQTQADKLVTQLKATPTLANFKTVVAKESDDKATKAKGGALGLKLPKDVYPVDTGQALSKTTQALAGPFKNEADGSQTIYFIAGRKLDLPADYAKNKKSLFTTFETQQKSDAWQKKKDELQKEVTPDVTDSEMAAYQLQMVDLPKKNGEEQTKMRQDVLSKYDAALTTASGMEAAAINFQKANLYRDMGQKVPQLDALKAAVNDMKSKPDAGLLIAYGQSLSDGGQPKVALEQFKAASKAMDDNPSPNSPFGGNPDDVMRQQLAQQFQLLKEPKLAAAETAKIKPSNSAIQGANNIQLGGAGGSPIQITPGK